jgi:hypothetical protein
MHISNFQGDIKLEAPILSPFLFRPPSRGRRRRRTHGAIGTRRPNKKCGSLEARINDAARSGGARRFFSHEDKKKTEKTRSRAPSLAPLPSLQPVFSTTFSDSLLFYLKLALLSILPKISFAQK